MTEYTLEELTDMHLIFGEAKENERETRKLCEQRFQFVVFQVILPFPELIDD